jgi:hypothetical protein
MQATRCAAEARRQPDLKGMVCRMTASLPARPFDDAYLLMYSREHVFHEIDMLFWLARLCGSGTHVTAPSPGDATRLNDAFIECFVVHLRNVIDFLYPRKPRRTDVVAADFCDSGVWQPTISLILKNARIRADKEMAHLTTARIFGGPPSKGWNFTGLSAELGQAIRCFVKKALPSRLSPKVAAAME